ncbi:hypothetical protein BS78_01G248100 [Paspalum vaginatum]|nr:hypothetical protein BS78_01G248100 [Paspalum vaginatum]
MERWLTRLLRQLSTRALAKTQRASTVELPADAAGRVPIIQSQINAKVLLQSLRIRQKKHSFYGFMCS